MSELQFLNTFPGWPYNPDARRYRVNITNVPERFVVKFMPDNLPIYGKPVAWVKFQIFLPGIDLIYPWIPITQRQVTLVQPVIGEARGGTADLHLETGVVGTIERIDI